MKNWERPLLGVFNRFSENRVLQAIRGGLILAIPAIACGCLALWLLSIPIPAYQDFIHHLWGGKLASLLTLVNNCTLGSISLILLLTISHCMEQQFSSNQRGILPIINLCSYIAFTVDTQNLLSFEIFQSVWMFNAILISVCSSGLYLWLKKQKIFQIQTYAGGSDDQFNAILSSLIPAGLIIVLFGIINLTLESLFGGENFQTVFSNLIFRLFSNMGRNLGSALIFIFSMHILWFFGIHGGNVLDAVAKNFFESGLATNQQLLAAGGAPTEIFTKTFFDTFILSGGCGALLCLLVAIFLFDKRKNVRNLSKIATLPSC